MKKILVVVAALLVAGCPAVRGPDQSYENRPETATGLMVEKRERVPPLDPSRKVSEQDCSRPVDTSGGNLMCKGEPTAAEREAERRRLEEEERQRKLAAERKARMKEEERLARAQREAAERAERERLERERAAQLAAAEAARKAQLAEEERLAAERKAREEREARERAEAEARERQRAEQEAREAAERECRRLEQERSDGRDMLADFVSKYGKVDEFKQISGQISAFLAKPRRVKPCPPARPASGDPLK
jgi:hypothetical protein